MKNLFLYVLANEKVWEKMFTEQTPLLDAYIKSQIDNSLNFGWKRDDILFVTNFSYEYNNVKAIQLNSLSKTNNFSNKLLAVRELFVDRGITDTIWLHDMDAWQNSRFDVPSVKDVGACFYWKLGMKNVAGTFNGGSIFYNPTAVDMLDKMIEHIEKDNLYKDESAFNRVCLSRVNKRRIEVSHRVTVLNNTYNIGKSWLKERYALADKPIRVFHFHPEKRWNKFCGDRNKLGRQLVSHELKQVLAHHFGPFIKR